MTMIDTWMIFSLFVPFMEVLLQTKIMLLTQKVENVSENSKKSKQAWSGDHKKANIKKKKNLKMIRYIDNASNIPNFT